MRVVLPAREFAAAWHNIAGCAGEDETLPVLYRTVAVEVYDCDRVRLVARDGRMVAWSWVASDDVEPVGLDVVPAVTWVAADGDRRAKALAAWLATAAKDDPAREVVLSSRSVEDDAVPTLAPELDRQALVVDADVETVTLPLIDGAFPCWRDLVAGRQKATATVGFAPDVLARFGKMRGAISVAFTLTGRESAALFRVECAGVPDVYGAVMPISGREV